MRLINTRSRKLQEFMGEDIPKQYAILSHCWVPGEEVSYIEYIQGPRTESYGYKKIEDCCKLALTHGLDWAWIDTCCIDKRSSAELSEAINSMFMWYERSTICYVFLNDFQSCDADHLDLECQPPNDPESSDGYEATGCDRRSNSTSLEDCRWFSRGWTLQEMIAPRNVFFYDKRMVKFGDKNQLVGPLSRVTGIEWSFLLKLQPLSEASVSMRMSWASKRITTQKEDIAYCLLGLFGINMPLLYGEGDRAFIRLQETILRTIEDDTLFAWTSDIGSDPAPRGLFADHPREFAHAYNITPAQKGRIPSHTLTNKGIELRSATPIFERLLRMFWWNSGNGAYRDTHYVTLSCLAVDPDKSAEEWKFVTLKIQRHCHPREFLNAYRYHRVDHSRLEWRGSPWLTMFNEIGWAVDTYYVAHTTPANTSSGLEQLLGLSYENFEPPISEKVSSFAVWCMFTLLVPATVFLVHVFYVEPKENLTDSFLVWYPIFIWFALSLGLYFSSWKASYLTAVWVGLMFLQPSMHSKQT